jgi:A/G-specific adenine glycosylase
MEAQLLRAWLTSRFNSYTFGDAQYAIARLETKVSIRRAVLSWFRQNARPLPWRQTSDPYAIWVSEVMLQQTQVATVIPYYRRFLQTFPAVDDLARAPLERVLELWSGLGYYRRARNLHRAAQVAAEKFGGLLPPSYDEVRCLPGIGDYTARAILSIAFNQTYAVLDGNVARVISRLSARRGNLHRPAFRRAVESDLEALLSRRQPGNFNQAVMELGQTVCLPRRPLCFLCPVHKWCVAYRLGNPGAFPSPRRRRATESHYLAAAVIRRGSKVAMVRGLGTGLLDDLWNFPSAFGESREAARTRLRVKLRQLSHSTVLLGPPLAETNHRITFRSISVQIYSTEFKGRMTGKSLRWLPMQKLNESAVSQLARKIAEKIREGSEQDERS